MLPAGEIKQFKNVQNALKVEIIKAKTRILPFRFFFDYRFEDVGKRDFLLIGKTAPDTLKALKAACGPVKAEGECRLVDGELRLRTEGGTLNTIRLKRFLKEAKIKFSAAEVEDFEGGAGAAQHARVVQESQRRLVDLSNRLARVRDLGEAGALLDKADTLLTKVRQVLAGGADAPQVGARLEEMLDAAARNIGLLEKNAVNRGKNPTEGRRADAGFEEGNEASAREIEALRELGAVTNRVEEATHTTLEQILRARAVALKWQKNEIAILQANQEQFERLQKKFREDESQLEQTLRQAEADLQRIRGLSDEASRLASSGELTSRAAKKKRDEWSNHQKELRKLEQSVSALQGDLRQLRKTFSQARAQVSGGDKHGTSRHGAHTGLEQQARRAAVGGTSADQVGNDWGDSTEKPELRRVQEAQVQGADTNQVSFDLGGRRFQIEYEDQPDGSRGIRDMAAALRQVEEIAREVESRGAKTSTSSSFLSPELEKEAVDRALKVARQCVWDEVWDSGKNDWVPLDRFFVYVGPPQRVRSRGWGHSVKRNTDSEGNSQSKMRLAEANKLLNAFRKGKIDQNQLMKALNVSMARSDDGGAILQPVARVMVDRSGSGWTNTSQYPTDDSPGWDLVGRKVRRSRDGDEGVIAPQASGV